MTVFDKELPGYDDACLDRAWPFAEPVARGPVLFRGADDDFIVEELPAYTPSGTGEHLYLHVEKRGVSTPALVKSLCATFGVHERDVGYAGRKDARGVTRQWLSLPARAVADPARLSELGAGVRVLEHARHGNKLRLGHLRGNRFTVHLAGDVDVAALSRRAALLAPAVPNLFGAQRFGPANDSLRQAERFLAKRLTARSRRDTFLVSVVQSALFNAWLAERIDDGTWRTPLDGDVLLKQPSGAPFICTDPAVDRARAAAGEVVVAGPLIGRAMRAAERDALAVESRCFTRLGITPALMQHPSFDVGARRAACVTADELRVASRDGGVVVEFSLAKGAYASVVLRALIGAQLSDAAFLDTGSD